MLAETFPAVQRMERVVGANRLPLERACVMGDRGVRVCMCVHAVGEGVRKSLDRADRLEGQVVLGKWLLLDPTGPMVHQCLAPVQMTIADS